MRERDYQAKIIKKLKKAFPGCVVVKNDSGYIQGIPDLTVLYGSSWAMLEVKLDHDSSVQPNQGYYVEKLDSMSFAAFVYPENEDQVFYELQRSFEATGQARLS